jgi:hypothetical protein
MISNTDLLSAAKKNKFFYFRPHEFWLSFIMVKVLLIHMMYFYFIYIPFVWYTDAILLLISGV